MISTSFLILVPWTYKDIFLWATPILQPWLFPIIMVEKQGFLQMSLVSTMVIIRFRISEHHTRITQSWTRHRLSHFLPKASCATPPGKQWPVVLQNLRIYCLTRNANHHWRGRTCVLRPKTWLFSPFSGISRSAGHNSQRVTSLNPKFTCCWWPKSTTEYMGEPGKIQFFVVFFLFGVPNQMRIQNYWS